MDDENLDPKLYEIMQLIERADKLRRQVDLANKRYMENDRELADYATRIIESGTFELNKLYVVGTRAFVIQGGPGVMPNIVAFDVAHTSAH